ncbi:hypothetical protein [Virgibacillus kimchii]
MRTGIALLSVLGLILFTGFLDSTENWKDYEGVNVMNDLAQDEEEASTSFAAEGLPAFTSVEMILEETMEDDGHVVEVYREYEIYTDEHGTVTKREPTDHYEYLWYKVDGEYEHDHEDSHEHE